MKTHPHNWKGGLDNYVPEPNSGCWLWLGTTAGAGYGCLWRDGGHVYAHRAMYERERGPIPAGMQIDHLCRVRSCVNPAHMEPVTPAENTRRGNAFSALNARKVECKHGHAFTPENTKAATRFGRPARVCRTCNTAKHRRKWDRLKAAGAERRALAAGAR